MRRLIMGVCALLLSLLGPLALPAPARAADDRISRLEVVYSVQDDASVWVTYTMDYAFAGSGRHGIDFSVVTSEPWGADATKQVEYNIQNFNVTSPTGAAVNAEYRDGDGVRTYRIGSATRVVDATETYVIKYRIDGALRTFTPGTSELYWDVTSRRLPPIDGWSVTVTAPGQVHHGQCAAGAADCGPGSAVERGWKFAGRGIPTGDILTVALQFPEIHGATPNLHERQVQTPTTAVEDLQGTLNTDGTLTVRQTMTVLLPPGRNVYEVRLPKRRAGEQFTDALYDVRDLRVTDRESPGAAVDTRPVRTDSGEYVAAAIQLEDGPAVRHVEVAYTLIGASGQDGTVAIPLAEENLPRMAQVTARIDVPADPGPPSCALARSGGRECPRAQAGAEGRTLTLRADHRVGGGYLRAKLPAGAVRSTSRTTIGQGFLHDVSTRKLPLVPWGIIPLAAIAWYLGARSIRGRRYLETPPGVLDDAAPQGPDDAPEIPVRFEPPQCSLSEAAALTGVTNTSTAAAAAVLAQMAYRGSLTLDSSPVVVAQRDEAALADPIETRVYNLASPAGATTTLQSDLSDIVSAIDGEVERQAAAPHMWVTKEQLAQLLARRRRPLSILLGLLAIVFLAVVGLLASQTTVAVWPVVLVLGGLAAAWLLHRAASPSKARSAHATALNDQVVGFRKYIETAEGRQLQFEEDHDVYARYLPWAILFGLAGRWKLICDQAAAAGTIPPQELPAGLALMDTDTVSYWPDRFRDEVTYREPEPEPVYSSNDDASGSESGDDDDWGRHSGGSDSWTSSSSSNWGSDSGSSSSWSSSSDSSSSSSSFSSGDGGGGTSVSSW